MPEVAMSKTASGLIVPDMPNGGIVGAIEPDEEELEGQGARAAKQLPDPKGYRLLIALPEVEDVTDGGIYKPQAAMEIEGVATVCGYVVAMGADAYQDKTRFPNGPYCEVGDWVVFRAFSGTRIKVHGTEFRLINDDGVEAVVEDPQGITRA